MRPSLVWFVLTLLVSPTLPLAAETPCVRFDVLPTVSAEEVTEEVSIPLDENEKLVRLRVRISSLARLNRDDTLVQYLYLISSASEPFQIVDFSPKTKLSSDVVGNVAIERSRGQSTSVGLKAHLPKDLPFRADATATHGADASDLIRYEQLPKLDVVASSGTMERGRAVYFKLRPSTRGTLEGEKAFEIVARVPKRWRAGLLELHCQALGRTSALWSRLEKEEDWVCGDRQFLIGAYLQDDSAARESVQAFVSSRAQLVELAHTHADDVHDERYPSWTDKLGAVLQVTKPRIPKPWLRELLNARDAPIFEAHLPVALQDAAVEFRRARHRLSQLST